MLLSLSIAFAQDYAPQQARRAFTQQQLDQMLAPIALYPDALLSQVLMAATYPVEVVEAARWSRGNPGLAGDYAVRAVERMDWDPSVKSLVAFPQILDMLDEKLEWTEDLGDAFLDQQAQVMDTVQYLRQKAYAAGNLRSTEQYRVDYEGSTFSIVLANPEMVYLPYYNPLIVYGAWWWPTHQPVYWAPWPGYHARPGHSRAFAWGPAIPVSRGFFYGAPDWHRRSINIVNVNTYYYRPSLVHRPAEVAPNHNVAGGPAGVWRHDYAHRRDVPYRSAAWRAPAVNGGAAPEARQEPRVAVQSAVAQPAIDGRGNFGNRQDARAESATRREERGNPQPLVQGPASATATRPTQERAPANVVTPTAAARPAARTPDAPSPEARTWPDHRGQWRGEAGGRSEVRGQPVVASAVGTPQNVERAPASTSAPVAYRQPEVRGATSQPSVPVDANRPHPEQRQVSGNAAGSGGARNEPRHAGPRERPVQQAAGSTDNSTAASAANATQSAGNSRGGGSFRH